MSTRAMTKRGSIFPSIFDDFINPWNEWFETNGGMGRMLTVPAVNITEDKDDFKISLAAPGMKRDDFEIDVKGNQLTISCEKEDSNEEKEKKFTRREYSYASFSRSFTLPEEVNREKIEAKYDEGVLRLSLPKKEEAKKAHTGLHISVK